MTPDDITTLYTISRIYALSGNKPEALKWLKTAIDKGFKYYWVLHSDTSWDKFREGNDPIAIGWKELIAKIPMTIYKASVK